MKWISLITILFLVICIISLPFGIKAFAEYEVLTILVVVLSLCFCISCILLVDRHLTITITDIVIVLLVIYEWINIAFIRHYQIDELVYYKLLVWGMVYLIVRQMRDTRLSLFLLAVALSGGVQSTVGILQYFDIIESPISDSDFNVTGCFRNPGPFGGYLSVSFMATVCLFHQNKMWLWRVGIVTLLLLTGTMLVYSDSRAAWLATLFSLLYFFYRFYRIYWQKPKFKGIFYSALLFLGIALITGLYLHKKTSADTRLLIWKNSIDMFADAPLCGHGIGSFAMKYMNYQADYFEHHPDSIFVNLSDNNTQSFNELITIFCEQGIIGGVLVLCIVGMALFAKESLTIKYLLLSLCVFSCFSYPSEILPLGVLFPLFIGLLPSRPIMCFRLRKVMAIQPLIILFPLLIYFSIGSKKRYGMAFEQLQKNESEIVLLHNKEYMSRYLKILIERKNFNEFIRLSTDLDMPFVTSVVMCDIGMSYMQLGEMVRAEQKLKSAYWMVPSKVLPKYFLFLFYRDTNCYDEARKIAEEIVGLKVSQMGSVYLSARSEARAFLNAGNDLE